jgi:hypothetical protein
MSQLDNAAIQSSRCFGVAYDKDAKECKVCEVANLCAQRVMGDVKKPVPTKPTANKNTAAENATETMKPAAARPEPQKEAAKPAKKEKPKKSAKNYDPSMPEDFKAMSLEDLESLAVERGLNLDDYAKYADVPIRRMRLTMGIKKTYEI